MASVLWFRKFRPRHFTTLPQLTRIRWGLIGPQYGIWYLIVFALLFLFSQPPITVGAQSLILREIAISSHGTASAVMYVAYQFGSSLFLAIVNVVLGGSDRSTPQGLLRGYHNSMWALLGIMAFGFIVFVIFYITQSLLGKEKKEETEPSSSATASDEEKTVSSDKETSRGSQDGTV